MERGCWLVAGGAGGRLCQEVPKGGTSQGGNAPQSRSEEAAMAPINRESLLNSVNFFIYFPLNGVCLKMLISIISMDLVDF